MESSSFFLDTRYKKKQASKQKTSISDLDGGEGGLTKKKLSISVYFVFFTLVGLEALVW